MSVYTHEMYTQAHTNDIDDTYTGRFPNMLLPVFSFDQTYLS